LEKLCSRCKETKPATYFNKSRARKDAIRRALSRKGEGPRLLPTDKNVRIVSDRAGVLGGIALWRRRDRPPTSHCGWHHGLPRDEHGHPVAAELVDCELGWGAALI
jgi:hypothetical protein